MRTRKESGRVRGTHFLESTKGMTSEATERKRASKRGALTDWKEGETSHVPKSKRARERYECGSRCQDIKTISMDVLTQY